MKRPIAEFLTLTVRAGTDAERRQYEHEVWQILRRKPGYVTHRIYQHASEPLQRLEYSEWESRKAVDGARQYLQGTPLMRRARAALATAPQRLVVDIVGPVTSTKGLDLPPAAVAATAITRLPADTGAWRAQEEQWWKALSSQPGHITHVLFRGFDDPLLVGSLSHWADPAALESALRHANSVAGTAVLRTLAYVRYTPIRG